MSKGETRKRVYDEEIDLIIKLYSIVMSKNMTMRHLQIEKKKEWFKVCFSLSKRGKKLSKISLNR